MKWWMYLLAILGAAGAVLLFVLSGGKAKLPDLSKDFKKIDAETEAKKLQKKLEHEEAVKAIEDKYKEELNALDEKQKEEAARLRDDPRALARYLVDVGSR